MYVCARLKVCMCLCMFFVERRGIYDSKLNLVFEYNSHFTLLTPVVGRKVFFFSLFIFSICFSFFLLFALSRTSHN